MELVNDQITFAFLVLSLAGIWKRERNKCQRESIVMREREREEKFKIYLVINSVSLGGGFPMKVKVTHRF